MKAYPLTSSMHVVCAFVHATGVLTTLVSFFVFFTRACTASTQLSIYDVRVAHDSFSSSELCCNSMCLQFELTLCADSYERFSSDRPWWHNSVSIDPGIVRHRFHRQNQAAYVFWCHLYWTMCSRLNHKPSLRGALAFVQLWNINTLAEECGLHTCFYC